MFKNLKIIKLENRALLKIKGEDSKEFFKQKNVQVLECKWDIDVPSYKVRGREYLKAQFSRFFLDLYFILSSVMIQ